MKQCSICKDRKSLDLFKKDSRNKDGRGSQCKACYNVNRRVNNPVGRARKWDSAISRKRYHRNAYKAAKSQRTPVWADIERIKEIYNDCPEGYEVDHIIPLRGKFVSGLHLESNLQYLTKRDNYIKRNNYGAN